MDKSQCKRECRLPECLSFRRGRADGVVAGPTRAIVTDAPGSSHGRFAQGAWTDRVTVASGSGNRAGSTLNRSRLIRPPRWRRPSQRRQLTAPAFRKPEEPSVVARQARSRRSLPGSRRHDAGIDPQTACADAPCTGSIIPHFHFGVEVVFWERLIASPVPL